MFFFCVVLCCLFPVIFSSVWFILFAFILCCVVFVLYSDLYCTILINSVLHYKTIISIFHHTKREFLFFTLYMIFLFFRLLGLELSNVATTEVKTSKKMNLSSCLFCSLFICISILFFFLNLIFCYFCYFNRYFLEIKS